MSFFYVDSRTRIAVTGDDRYRWPQGVLTQDVRPMEAAIAYLATYSLTLTNKGKILADVIAIGNRDHLDLWLPEQVSANVIAVWERLIVMEDVELQRHNEDRLVWVGQPVEGAIAFDVLGAQGGVLFTAQDRLDEVKIGLQNKGLEEISATQFAARSTDAARGVFGRDFGESHYVQEVGLEGRAASFSKGCYVGQEIVCMLQSRGKVHRRLVRIALDQAAAMGESLLFDGTIVGAISSLGSHSPGFALAMIKASAAAIGTELRTEKGTLARVDSLAW
jgi:folate-binding protein YgfZ